MLAILALQALVLLRRTHPRFTRTVDYFVIDSWHEEAALTIWATFLYTADLGFEPRTSESESDVFPLHQSAISGSTGIEPVLRESKSHVLPLDELPSGKNRIRTCTAWSESPRLYHWSYLPRWVHRAIILIARWYGLAKVAYLLSADMYELLHYVLACKHANICNTHAYAPHMRPWLNFAQKNRLPY